MHAQYQTRRLLCSEVTKRGPLHGLKVLDMSRILAGPYCSQLLGDMGAEVIKVEHSTGDGTRTWGPPFVGKESTYFLSVNRNKKSIVVDIKKQAGRQIIMDLAAKCDVFIENFLPGKLTEAGLGWENIQAVNPRIVYCSISGFGATGKIPSI
jgi:succinate---hydroxymethylglutarate CoA-transferase